MKSIKSLLLSILLKSLSRKNIVKPPRIISSKAKRCIGYAITTSLKENKKQVDIPPFFHEVYDNNKLAKLNNNAKFDMYCIFDFHKNQQDFDYHVAVEKKSPTKDENYAEVTLPGGKYIQVEILKRNHKVVGLIIMYLRKIWIQQNGYKEKNTPPYILYDERFHANYKKYGCKGENYLGNPLAVLHIPVE